MNRVIYLTEDIAPTSGENIRDNSLIKQFSESLFMADNKENLPIHVMIDTDGGNVKTALAIYDIMQSTHAPVYTYALSEVSSAGVLIYIGGERRFAFNHSQFMLHPASLTVSGNHLEFDNTMSMVKSQTERVEDIFKKRIRMGKRKFNNLHSSTNFMTCQEAKKLKIVTTIIDKLPLELLDAYSPSMPAMQDIDIAAEMVLDKLMQSMEEKEKEASSV